ncbi:MAG: redoxin domain-containing protein [Halobacteriovoraceae bacterium]|nr:redoxin domain-containing protein [Halobacteriovoraceae bacterium]
MRQDKAIIVNFVLGTWCPLCIKHFQDIYVSMKQHFLDDRMEILFVSTEPEKRIQKSFKDWRWINGEVPDNIFLGSDQSRELINILKIKIPVFGFAKPATFLIEKDGLIVKISEGIPNSEKTVCELSHYVV